MPHLPEIEGLERKANDAIARNDLQALDASRSEFKGLKDRVTADHTSTAEEKQRLEKLDAKLATPPGSAQNQPAQAPGAQPASATAHMEPRVEATVQRAEPASPLPPAGGQPAHQPSPQAPPQAAPQAPPQPKPQTATQPAPQANQAVADRAQSSQAHPAQGLVDQPQTAQAHPAQGQVAQQPTPVTVEPRTVAKTTSDRPPGQMTAYFQDMQALEQKLDEANSRSAQNDILMLQAEHADLVARVGADPKATGDEKAILGALGQKLERLTVPRTYPEQLHAIRVRLDEAVAKGDGAKVNAAKLDWAKLQAKLDSDGGISPSMRAAADAMHRRIASLAPTPPS